MALRITKDYKVVEPNEMIESYIQECEQLVSSIQDSLNTIMNRLSSMKYELELLKSEKQSN